MKRSAAWLAMLLVLSLLAACSNAGNYLKDHYDLIDAQGKGKSTALVYLMEGKTVPEAAKELAEQEKPNEVSKENADQMFLVYDSKLIHLQKAPNDEKSTIAETETVAYAKEHYDSSFLQGYLTASLLQSLFGGGWFNSGKSYDYRGYTQQSVPRTVGSGPGSTKPDSDVPKPSTTDRTGSFNSKPAGSTGKTGDSLSGTTNSNSRPASSTGRTGTFTTKPSSKPSSSYGTRKNDGSTPSYKKPSTPKTSKRIGSFSKRR